MSYWIARLLANLFMWLTARIDVTGMENIPQEGGFIVVSNHLGRLDVPLVYVFIKRRDITMMVAEKYRKYAIFRWFVRSLNAIWVDRYNADLVAVRESLHRLRQGGVLAMAPEGTRSKTEALIEAQPGVSYLAARAGMPILPVGITGTEDRLVVSSLKHLQRAQICLRVGKPFTLPPLDPQDREAALRADTDEIMCQIAALLPSEKRGVYAQHARTLELIATVSES